MSIYDFKVKTIDGKETTLAPFQGKVLLIVNVASECGFTPQYAGLEELYKKYKDRGFEVPRPPHLGDQRALWSLPIGYAQHRALSAPAEHRAGQVAWMLEALAHCPSDPSLETCVVTCSK